MVRHYLLSEIKIPCRRKLKMRKPIFRGEYRGFIIRQEIGASGVLVRDPLHEWADCMNHRFRSISEAEDYIDFVIEQYHLSRPPKPSPGHWTRY